MPRVARATTEKVVVATRRSTRSRTIVNYTSQLAVEEPEEVMDPGSKSPLTDLESEGVAEIPPKRKRRRTKVTEPVVYDIPPVETKTSKFKGKSGNPGSRAESPAYNCLTPRSIGIRAFHMADATYLVN